MQFDQTDHVPDNRLRFVFDNTVVSYRVAANTTFEDIARRLGPLTRRHHGNPIAIDITLRSPKPGSLPGMGDN
jgi:hypothetical protein